MKHRHMALVIDDQQGVLETVKAILFSMEHDFDTARTQREALELLDSRAYCYVLLDLEFPADEGAMPRIRTGFNCLEAIRRRFRREELPVVIMTAHENGTEYPIRALQLGANDFAKKPFDDDLEPLEVKVQRVLAGGCSGRGRRPLMGSMADADRARRAPADAPGQGEEGPRLHFHGECRKRRYRLEIDGEVFYVRLGTFTILWRLAAAAMSGGPGWVAGRVLNPGNYHNAISRLRQDLAETVGGDGTWVEGDGHGSFRLEAAGRDLSFDQDAMRVHHGALVRDAPQVPVAHAPP